MHDISLATSSYPSMHASLLLHNLQLCNNKARRDYRLDARLTQPACTNLHTNLTPHTPFRFWQACRDLQTVPLGSVTKSAQLIYQEFLSTSAASAVNLSASVRKEAKEDANPAHRYSFASAQAQVLELMRKDVYPRYLKSPQYLEFISNEKPSTFGRK